MHPGIIGSFGTVPGVSNFTRENNSSIIAGLASTKNGSADTLVAALGDSVTAGKGGGTGDGWGGARPFAYPRKLAAALNAVTIPSIQADFWGEGTSSGSVSAIDNYMVNISRSGTGFALSSSVSSVGGFCHAQNNIVDSTSTITYTCPPGVVANNVKIFVARNPGIGDYVVSIDGGAESSAVPTAGTAGAFTTAFSLGSAATGHTVRIRKSNTTAAGVYILGVYFYNTASPSIQIWNWGRGAWKTDDWVLTTAAWTQGNQYHTQGQHLTIINCIINDFVARPTSSTTTITNLNTMVTALQSAGSTVWLVLPQYVTPSIGTSVTQQDAYRSAVASLATTKNCPLVDLTYYYPSWTAWSTSGLDFDGVHPNGSGYQHFVDSFYRPMFQALYAAV